uniref:Uncharacterized protein n=1 Tax=Panagrolaimus sp. PS1159 TaxID=55785 RepID=A0AC35FMP7_9BILA
MKKKKRHPFYPYFRFKQSHSSISKKKFNAAVNSQVQHGYEIQNLKTKFDKLEEEYNRLKNQYEILYEKIENSGAKTIILNGDNDFFHPLNPEITKTSINNIQIPSNNSNVDEYNNFEAEVVNNTLTLTPVWIVEKSKCKKMLEKSQNQISSFLPLYLPEIYNSAELISPAYFPNATEKHQEINAIIKYFWKNQSSQDFYAKSIEKELQIQRYKVTRKMYHLLKSKDFCIMGKDGKVYDCLDKNRIKSVTLLNDDGIVEEWLIPDKLIYDDYVIAAKKDEENKTIIYKLDLVSSLMKVIYTKRK